jgi:hypothetical protein
MSQVPDFVAKLPSAPLGPGTPHEELRSKLNGLNLPPLCMSGLWLRCNFLPESHEISQELHSKEGSFWHAIMHRREPDASNSKYWFRRVGHHPVLKQLVERCPELGYNFTNPYDFVDFCEKHRDTGTPEEALAKRVQQFEWELLFNYGSARGVLDGL